jgi:hypothetical protein
MLNFHSLSELTPKNIVVWTGRPGEIKIRFDKISGCSHYIIELSPVGHESEIIKLHTYKNRLRVKGLKPGTEYGLRVRGVMVG